MLFDDFKDCLGFLFLPVNHIIIGTMETYKQYTKKVGSSLKTLLDADSL
jgi:hypothetical protein